MLHMSWQTSLKPCSDFSTDNENYEIEGTIYPPSQPDSAPRTIGHLCSEYTTEELQECVPYLKDLQLCLEHDTDTVIGKVIDASLTPSKGMWIKAVVSASSTAGKETIRKIKAQQLPGLSLSHDFHLFAKPGSELQRLIQSAREWQQMEHDGTQASCRKTLRELSVCKEPAREGCYIHKPLMSGMVQCSSNPQLKSLQRLLALLPQAKPKKLHGTVQDNARCHPAGRLSYIFIEVHVLRDVRALTQVCGQIGRPLQVASVRSALHTAPLRAK